MVKKYECRTKDLRIDITTIRIQGTLQKRDGWLATYLYHLFKGISVFIAVMTHQNVPVHHRLF